MTAKFQVGDRVIHVNFLIEFEVVSVKQGQNQYFYDLKQDEDTIINDVAEKELERVE